MLYVHTDELTLYAARANFNTADRIPAVNTAAELTEAFLGRSLAVSEYTEIVRLSAGMSGWLSVIPIREIVSMRVRQIQRTMEGGFAVGPDGWYDISPENFSTFVNFRTGRVDIYTPVWDGYGRFNTNLGSAGQKYEAEIVYKAGLYAASTLIEDADLDTNRLVLDDVSFFEPNMKITIGTTGVLHTIDYVDGDALVLTENITEDYFEYDEVAQRVSKPIKIAVGMICEDRATYLPNVLRQSRRISVLTDTLRRSNTLPIPPDAMTILAKYRRRNWV